MNEMTWYQVIGNRLGLYRWCDLCRETRWLHWVHRKKNWAWLWSRPFWHLVTQAAMRPASHKQECFYCHERIGGRHKDDCVLVRKKVKVRMIVEYEIEVPNFWDGATIEFARNESSWCATNAIGELKKFADQNGCLCNFTTYEYLHDTSGPFLGESPNSTPSSIPIEYKVHDKRRGE